MEEMPSQQREINRSTRPVVLVAVDRESIAYLLAELRPLVVLE